MEGVRLIVQCELFFRAGGRLGAFGAWRGSPKARHRHDEFDGNLSFAHETGTHVGDAAKQFLPGDQIFDVNHLLDTYGGREKQQRSVIVDDYGVGVLLDRMLAGVLQADPDGDPAADAFAAAAILPEQVRWGLDGHVTT
jgi:hypothetical protein